MPSLSLSDVTPASSPPSLCHAALPSMSISLQAWFQGAPEPLEVGSTFWTLATTHDFPVTHQLGL